MIFIHAHSLCCPHCFLRTVKREVSLWCWFMSHSRYSHVFMKIIKNNKLLILTTSKLFTWLTFHSIKEISWLPFYIFSKTWKYLEKITTQWKSNTTHQFQRIAQQLVWSTEMVTVENFCRCPENICLVKFRSKAKECQLHRILEFKSFVTKM